MNYEMRCEKRPSHSVDLPISTWGRETYLPSVPRRSGSAAKASTFYVHESGDRACISSFKGTVSTVMSEH